MTPDEYPIHELDVPPLLREIADPPQRLHIRGTMPSGTPRYLAVVGSRRYTPYGKQVCERLIAGLRGCPVVIVSGLALGMDGIAHQAALDAGLTTIAIPGSGLSDSVLYPATHRKLARDILESGGALISEFAPDFRATPYSFPQRNRIMAGLSHAVLVIEAEERSGTLITSRLATEYNRDVLAVPGPVHSKTAAGPHMLIKKGAALIAESTDILEALGLEATSAETDTVPSDLSPDEALVYKLLATPKGRQVLIDESGLDVSRANVLLSSLEIKGLIAERLGLLERA
jgi:DNA processing protein